MPIPVTRLRTASVRKWGRNACSPTLTMSSGQVCRMTALRRWGSATAPAAMRRSASRSVASLTVARSEEHTSELQSHSDLVCRLLLEKKKNEQTSRHENERLQDD